ncbi:MAG: amidohydrolase family protein, partial [Dehalococcoidia bacterium]
MAKATVDLVVHGGRVALPGGACETAIAIDGERIVAVGAAEMLPEARRYLDVTGKDVLPGAIDGHSHIGFDDLSSLPRSSAFGGITTSVPFIGRPSDTGSLGEVLRAHREEAERRSVLDLAFHAYLYPGNSDGTALLAQMDEAISLGVRSFKMFTAYGRRGMQASDGFIYRACVRLAALGGVPMVHAENGDLIDALEDRLM